MMTTKKLPLRIGVGAIVLNKKNQVFVGKRKDNPVDKWQMPQGGVNEGEDLTSAMKRELNEETGIENIKILKYQNIKRVARRIDILIFCYACVLVKH